MNMTKTPAGLIVASVACASFAASFAGAEAPAVAELEYKSHRTWSLELPAERFEPVSAGFRVPHAGGEVFAVGLEGTALRVDTDGDGELDRTIEASKDDFGVRHARVTLRGERPDGAPFRYAVRLRDAGKGWQYAAGGTMSGRVGDTPVQLIDQNNNGRYDDYGEDAMIVGRRKSASFLSRVISVDGTLLSIDVSPAGDAITATPFAGETGKLDMTTGCDTSARLVNAIVRSVDGSVSFDLGNASSGITVPAGAYEIHSGRIGLGHSAVRVRRGRAAALDVTPGAEVTFDWGGPVEAEFDYMRQGDQVVFDPNTIWYYGAAGEEYHGWYPIGKSPEFTLTDRSTGEVLEVLILPGSC